MARAQAKLGNEVWVYATNQDGSGSLPVPIDKTVHQDGVEIRYFPVQFPRFWGTSLPLGRALREIIPGADIVAIHTPYLFHTVAAALCCRRCGVPYVLVPHGTLVPRIHGRHRYRKRIVELLFQDEITRRASAIHFMTEGEKTLSERNTLGAPGFVIPLGLNIEEYGSRPSKGILFSRFPTLKGKKIILFLGRINYVKGLDILARAFAAVAREREDVHLLIAGPDDDGYEGRVTEWLREGSVLEKTTFTGILLGEEKLEAFYGSSVFVLPSYSENFGLSVLEAMACGLPVVVSDKVNLWPAIKEARAGEVATCDAEVFSQKILQIIDDVNLSRQLGMNGRFLARAPSRVIRPWCTRHWNGSSNARWPRSCRNLVMKRE